MYCTLARGLSFAVSFIAFGEAAHAQAAQWEFRTYVSEGGARAGAVSRAEIRDVHGSLLSIACGYDGKRWVTVGVGTSDPQRFGPGLALRAKVEDAKVIREFDLALQYSLSAYSAPAPAGFVDALQAGRLVWLDDPNGQYSNMYPLDGSSRAIGQLDC